jgi:hypothetical protein
LHLSLNPVKNYADSVNKDFIPIKRTRHTYHRHQLYTFTQQVNQSLPEPSGLVSSTCKIVAEYKDTGAALAQYIRALVYRKVNAGGDKSPVTGT